MALYFELSLLGLFTLSCVSCFSFSHFIASKLKQFLTSSFFPPQFFFVFGFSPEFSSCFKTFGIVIKQVYFQLDLTTRKIVECLLTLERLMCSSSPVLCHERSLNTDLETANAAGCYLCKEPQTALE